jgi:hypothetical protein
VRRGYSRVRFIHWRKRGPYGRPLYVGWGDYFVNDGTPPLTMRRTPERGAYGTRTAILAATTLVLTVLGPFGTFKDFTFLPRTAYWGGLIFCGALAFEAAIRLCFRLPVLAARSWRVPVAAAIFLTAGVQTAAVWVVETTFRPPLPVGLVELYVYVLLVTLLVSAAPLWRELRGRGLLSSPPAPSTPPPTAITTMRPAFYDRIPSHLSGELLALEMEDHYLRVHTDGGGDLLLMRLRDAVAELAGADGMQVHRSWWVAAAAVVRMEKDADGRIKLILRNGLRVPVSRSRAAMVRAAGWPVAARVPIPGETL